MSDELLPPDFDAGLKRAPSFAPPKRAPKSKMAELIDEDVVEQGQFKVFLRFLKYLWPHKYKVLLILLTTFVGVPLTQIGILMSRTLVDDVILNDQEAVARRMKLFFLIVGLQALMWAISRVMFFVRQVMNLGIEVSVTATLRRMFYSHLQTLSIDFFRTRPIGEHMYRTGEVGGLLPLVRDDTTLLIDKVYRIIWGAIIVSMVDWRITVFVLVYIVPYTFMAYWAYTFLQRVNVETRIQGQRATAVLRDSVAGIKTVKGYGRTRQQISKYGRRLGDQRRVGIKNFFISVLTHQYALWFYKTVVDRLKWLYIGWQTMVGNLSIGEFSVMFWLIGQLEQPMEEIVRHIQNIRIHLVPAMRVLETLDIPPDIIDAPDAAPMPPVRGEVEFRNVSLEYVPGTPVLKNVSLKIPPGACVAFVGPSGAGKSTLLYLLMRLYDPTSGQVLMDGMDLRRVKLRTYLDQIGTVLQDTFLFGGSVLDNVRYGDPHAGQEAFWGAIHGAELEGFVSRLPHQERTHLGEGTKLSGGERQRMGLARVMIRNPKVLLMDEPTAYLDSRTETSIMKTFAKAAEGRTTLIVSHRLIPIRNVDVIYVLDKGELVEQGRHEELLALGGLYKRLWDEQTRLRGKEGTKGQ
ncbi:MAG: ABC transporter ATP-binding protein [Planctomycetota bacterium]